MKYRIICLHNAGFSSWDEPHTRQQIIDKFMDYARCEFEEMPPKKWFTMRNIADTWEVKFERITNYKMLADTNLYSITYETEGGLSTIFTVGVDMDEATAELRVLKEIRAILDDQHINLYDAGVGEVFFAEVPKDVDNFNIVLEESGYIEQ